MSRTISSSLTAVLGDAEIEPYYAVDLDFPSGNLRLWTGFGNRTISSNTYLGSGDLMRIDGLEEASDLSSRGTTLTFSGVPSNLVTYALTEEYQGHLCYIYWGIKSVSDVVEVFSGYMDKITIQDDGETSTISLSVESRLITLERPNARRYTQASHDAVIATEGYDETTDTFFKWVTQLQDQQIPWGRSNVDEA
jgi:hypothetical protein